MLPKKINVSLKEPFNSDYNFSKRINDYLYIKYSNNEFSYSRICTNNLLSHQTCRIVARFTDFLIFDDNTEFLHEFCNKNELHKRLQYIFNFYHSYSKIYPNYLIIPENKFLYKNLRKKQKVIDEENAVKFCTPKNKKSLSKQNINYKNYNTNNNENEKNDLLFFNKSIIESINRQNISSNNNSTKKCSNISYSNELNYLISSISSETKKSRNLNMPRKSCDSISKQKIQLDLEEIILNNKICDDINTNISFNSQSSSNLKNNIYSEDTQSKDSITDIINLINGKNTNIINNKIKNGSSDKINKKKIKNIKQEKKYKFNFLMLDFDNIKKNIKTHKTKVCNYNNVKNENNKIPSIVKEQRNNKKNYLKNYPQKNELNGNNTNKNKNIVYHKQAVSCLEDISKILKNNSKTKKNQQLNILSKINNNKFNSKSNEHHNKNWLGIQTVTSFGNIGTKKYKISVVKNNVNNNRKQHYSRPKKSLNFITNISTNSTINFGNSYYKINKVNNNNKQNMDIHIINNNKQKYPKNKNNRIIMNSIETLISLGERKPKMSNDGDIKKVFKLETDSLQSTQVSLNKKTNQRSTQKLSYIDKILTQIKRTIRNLNTNNNKNNNTVLSSFTKKYNTEQNNIDFKIKDNISSYGCKPFHDYFQKNTNVAKIKLKKQKTSTLINNNNIFNFFTSKDFYNLKINNNNTKSQNKSVNKNTEKIQGNVLKKLSTNKITENYRDININDSNSFILKTFNKDNICNNSNNINNNMNSNINKTSKRHKFNFKNFDFDKIKKNYRKYLCNNICKRISYERPDNINNFYKTHKKNNTTNICKNIEEINKKKNFRNHKRNHIIILNSINKKNMNVQIKFKTPSKTIIKSLEMKNNKNCNNTNIKDDGILFVGRFNINNNISELKMKKMI